MSQIQVANVVLNSAGSTRMETTDGGANVRIVIESANVMYANPSRTVFPTGTVNVAGDMTVAGALRGSGVANIAGDMTVAGNIYAAGGTSPLGAPSIDVTVGTNTIANIPSGKYLRITGWGVIPSDASGGQPRIYLSSDNGSNYGPPIYVAPDSSGNNVINFVAFISNTSIAGTNKEVKVIGRSMDAFSSTSPPYAISSQNTHTESTVTGIINAIKANCSSGLNFNNTGMMVESIN